MQSTLQPLREVISKTITFSRRQVSALDFVWLARFRFLFLYSLIKFGLLLAIGITCFQLNTSLLDSAGDSLLLIWIGIVPGLVAGILVLILGLGLASKFRMSRSLGLLMVGLIDSCILLAIMYAALIHNMLLLLAITALITCITPLLVERISRYAKRSTHHALELVQVMYERDLLQSQQSQQIIEAVEHERSVLQHHIHDGVMQELSVLQLKLDLLLTKNTTDNGVHLRLEDVRLLKVCVDRVVAETHIIVQELHPSLPILEDR